MNSKLLRYSTKNISFLNVNSKKTGWSRIIITILLVIGSLAGVGPSRVFAAGTTYYVNNTNASCSDTGSGTTSAQPFCKISKGASVAVAGDTVRVLAGTYAETVTPPKSGSANLPITFSAAPGVTVTGAASYGFRVSGRSYVIIDGFNVTGTTNIGISVSTSDRITISNNHVTLSGKPVSGSARAGINIAATTNSTISGNTTDHNSSYGIYLSGGSSGNTVNDNVSFANAQQYQRVATGINVFSSNNNIIIHNITYANEDTGIQIYTGSTGNSIIGNVSYGNADHGIDLLNSPTNTIIGNTIHGNYTSGINVEGTSTGATIANNIAVDNGIAIVGSGQPGNIRVDANSIAGSTSNYNIVFLTGVGKAQIQWNGTNYATLAAFRAAYPAQEVNGLQANPLFVAPVTPAVRPNSGKGGLPAVNVGDYHIGSSSPAIDSANSNASGEPLLDVEGNARVDDPATANTGTGVRSYDDRGSYEFQPVSGTPTSTPQPATPTSTLTPTTTPTFTSTPTATPTSTPLSTMTSTPINTSTPTPTFTTTPIVTNTPTTTPTMGPTSTPTSTFTPVNTVLPTATFTASPTTVPSGSTSTFLPDADSHVNQSSANSNYGTNAQLWVDYDATASFESYLTFTVSGVSGTVQSAVLRVYSTSSTVDGPAVYATNLNWTETGITWNTRPARTSEGMDDKAAIATGKWVEYNVTPLVVGDGTYSFALVTTSTDSVSFSSREGSQPPQLVLNIGP